MRVPGDGGEAARPQMPAPSPSRESAAAAPVPAGGGAPIRRGNDDVPLRELALAWFEARGYRSAPASAAVRPIEQVLRHRHDPARAYAFVVESGRVSAERVQQLRTQARSIGLLRVLIVANDGADEGAALKSKGCAPDGPRVAGGRVRSARLQRGCQDHCRRAQAQCGADHGELSGPRFSQRIDARVCVRAARAH
jgi:hypothetical protein